MRTTELINLAADCRTQLRDQFGLEICELRNTPDIHRLVADMGKPLATPMLNPLQNDFSSATSFWLAAWQDDEIAILIGVRLEQLGYDKFSEYFQRSMRRLYPNSQLGEVSPALDKSLVGNIAYTGDLFAARRFRQHARRLTAFSGYLFATILLKWDVQAIYAFMHQSEISRNLDELCGFQARIKTPYRWRNPVDGRANDEWCVLTDASTYTKTLDGFWQRVAQCSVSQSTHVDFQHSNSQATSHPLSSERPVVVGSTRY